MSCYFTKLSQKLLAIKLLNYMRIIDKNKKWRNRRRLEENGFYHVIKISACTDHSTKRRDTCTELLKIRAYLENSWSKIRFV